MGLMTGNGKIARLPRALRDELNRRMGDGQTGQELLLWLNRLPKVKNSWPNSSPDGSSPSRISMNGALAAIAFGWPGGKRSPRPADDGDFRPGLNHENYQTNPNVNFDST